jgi:hypothetical protein
VAVRDLTIGPFSGELQFTFYPTSRLVREQWCSRKVISAILYDAGLWAIHQAGSASRGWTPKAASNAPPSNRQPCQPLGVRHRTVAEADQGSIACFPPPHQFQFPRDWTDNWCPLGLATAITGKTNAFGFGVRQVTDGQRSNPGLTRRLARASAWAYSIC